MYFVGTFCSGEDRNYRIQAPENMVAVKQNFVLACFKNTLWNNGFCLKTEVGGPELVWFFVFFFFRKHLVVTASVECHNNFFVQFWSTSRHLVFELFLVDNGGVSLLRQNYGPIFSGSFRRDCLNKFKHLFQKRQDGSVGQTDLRCCKRNLCWSEFTRCSTAFSGRFGDIRPGQSESATKMLRADLSKSTRALAVSFWVVLCFFWHTVTSSNSSWIFVLAKGGNKVGTFSQCCYVSKKRKFLCLKTGSDSIHLLRAVCFVECFYLSWFSALCSKTTDPDRRFWPEL